MQISPVEPREKAFGCSDQVHHGGKKVVGQLARGSAVVMAAAPPACDEVLQVLGRCIELMRESLQILSLQPIILEERGKVNSLCLTSLSAFVFRISRTSTSVEAETDVSL